LIQDIPNLRRFSFYIKIDIEICEKLYIICTNFYKNLQIMVIGSNQDGKQDIPQPPPSRQTVVAGNARRGGRPLITTSKKKVAVGILDK
jgi:hypothetical protein